MKGGVLETPGSLFGHRSLCILQILPLPPLVFKRGAKEARSSATEPILFNRAFLASRKIFCRQFFDQKNNCPGSALWVHAFFKKKTLNRNSRKDALSLRKIQKKYDEESYHGGRQKHSKTS